MIHPIQKLKNFKNKLSVPIVTEQMLTQNNKLAEQLAKQYEKKLRQLIYINLILLIPIILGWKYWYQYRLGYNYCQSLDYVCDVIKRHMWICAGLGIPSVFIWMRFTSLYVAIDPIDNCNAKIDIQKKYKYFIRAYWLGMILYLNFLSCILILLPTKLIMITIGITLCLVWFIKYVALYIYKHYHYQVTYYQLFIFIESLNIIGVLFTCNMWGIANILLIYEAILNLMRLFEDISNMKEKFNETDYYAKRNVEIYAYDSAYKNTYKITIWLFDLYAKIFAPNRRVLDDNNACLEKGETKNNNDFLEQNERKNNHSYDLENKKDPTYFK